MAEKFSSRPGEHSPLEKRLSIENIALRLKLNEGDEIRKENEKLKQALKFQEDKKTILLGAEVIAFDPSSWRRQVILNRGKKYGIQKGMYVINGEGALIGKISESTQNYCKLSLLSDPDFSMPKIDHPRVTNFVNKTDSMMDVLAMASLAMLITHGKYCSELISSVTARSSSKSIPAALSPSTCR